MTDLKTIAKQAREDADRAADLKTTIEGLENGVDQTIVRIDILLPSFIERSYVPAAAVEAVIRERWDVIVSETLERAKSELVHIEARWEGFPTTQERQA